MPQGRAIMEARELNVFVQPALILFGLAGLLTQSFLMYFLEPLPQFRPRCRKALEGTVLGLLVLLGSDLLLDIQLDQPEPYGSGLRLVLCSCLFILAVKQRKQDVDWRSLCLAGAAALPCWDAWYPLGMGLALLIFWGRALDLLPSAIREKRQQITEYSIQEAIDLLEEGILITLRSGEPVLMNRALFQYTESVLGVGIRNGNVLWHLLQDVRRPGLLRENQSRGLLFRLPDGRWLLFQRDTVYFQGQSHWQLTASDVTELQRLNQSLDQQNRQLQQKNAELKELLQHVQEIQSRETLREIRIQIHDLMGMRISLLQQVLNNRDFGDYRRIMPLLSNMLSDVRQEIRVEPRLRLAELVSVYRKLGVLVTVRGTLPEAGWKGELYVQIIREALTNAICHGRASQVALVLGEDSLLIQDNGVGCVGPIRPGGGLTGIREKVESRGGKLDVSGTPHFMLKIRFEAKEQEAKSAAPDPDGG